MAVHKSFNQIPFLVKNHMEDLSDTTNEIETSAFKTDESWAKNHFSEGKILIFGP